MNPSRQVRRAQDRARRRLQVGPCDEFVDVPAAELPSNVDPPGGTQRVLRSSRFIVLDVVRGDGVRLLMVQRLDGRPGITWDELYSVKEGAGYADREAVEIYPETDRLVNVANMRHLWVLPHGVRMPFGLDADRRSR